MVRLSTKTGAPTLQNPATRMLQLRRRELAQKRTLANIPFPNEFAEQEVVAFPF